MPDLASDFRPYLRKERDWLIRAASGPDFFPALSQALRPYPGYPDLEGPLSWHIDVHIDWIIAVLGGGSRGSRLANPSIDGKKLIRGSNEDFDLICFAGQDLVIVEAKGEGHWSRQRIAEKLARLSYLAPQGQGSPHARGGRVFFALTSPRPPSTRVTSGHGRWENLPWVELEVPPADERRRVVRCDADGNATRDGDFYIIK